METNEASRKMAAVQRATLRLKSLQKRTLKPPSFTFSTVSAETDVLIQEGKLRGNAISELNTIAISCAVLVSMLRIGHLKLLLRTAVRGCLIRHKACLYDGC
jgi:aminoglycoside phosphotransferase